MTRTRGSPREPGDVAAYRRLLRFFPRAFRARWGEEMVRLYADRRSEVEGRRGARVRLRAAATLDVLVQAAREWVRVGTDGAEATLREAGSMDGWIQDLKFGTRGLLRRPGFTAAAVSTLALGIGAVVAIFSVVDGVLLKPLPYPHPERVVVPWQVDTRNGERYSGIDRPDVRAWQGQVPGLRVAGYSTGRPTLTGTGDPEIVNAARVTDGLLGVLGLEPALGRDITAADDVPDGPKVVLVSHAFWESHLGGDATALGRTLELAGERWEVVGVAPEGFAYPAGVDLWMPRQVDTSECGHGCRVLRGIGRIETGASWEQVEARMDAASAALAEAFPDSHRDLVTRFEPLLDAQVADVRVALWVLMGSVTMVLLIACANVANLLLVRASERVGEVALRATLGAPRIRLVRQLLTESLILSSVGGLLGVGLATWGVSLMVAAAPPGIPRLGDVAVDGGVLGFALLVVLAVTAIFGLVPALRLVRRPLQEAMGGDRRAAGGRRSGLSRSFLLSAEVALSLVLLLGAGLMFGTLRSIATQELGFSTERVERFRVALPVARYDAEAQIRFFDELERRAAALPEVAHAGLGFGVPLGSGYFHVTTSLLDRPPVDPADLPELAVRPSTPGYREAIGLPLLRGRWFEEGDRTDAEAVAVINQAAADRYYPDVDPLGRRIRIDMDIGLGDDPERTIVGVVGDTRSYSATEPDDPTAYVPNAQIAMGVLYLTMKLAPGARTALPSARALLKEMDPTLATTNVERIEDAVARQSGPTRFYLTLIGAFSLLALLLAAVGLYGVVAYSVSRRTREIGIRVALGARGGQVVGMALREGVVPALAGVAAGLVAALLGARFMDSLLYGVEPQDPLTMATVTAILLAVVLAATLVPARRASRVPPATALRAD